jgi:putative ATP-dependent endonuclease of the OLD family
LVYNTFIPDYILNAIAFASAHMDSSSKYKSALYRLKAFSKHEEHNKNKEAKEFSLKDKSETEVIKEFCKKFSDDQLTFFLTKL